MVVDDVGTLTPTHTYISSGMYGSYNVGLRVTTVNGDQEIGWLTVTVRNVAPTATVTHNGPVNEGSLVQVTIADVTDPDPDEFTYWADWENTGEFYLVTEYSTRPNGEILLEHTYDDNHEEGLHTAVIR
jgi:hypothetical protein